MYIWSSKKALLSSIKTFRVSLEVITLLLRVCSVYIPLETMPTTNASLIIWTDHTGYLNLLHCNPMVLNQSEINQHVRILLNIQVRSSRGDGSSEPLSQRQKESSRVEHLQLEVRFQDDFVLSKYRQVHESSAARRSW